MPHLQHSVVVLLGLNLDGENSLFLQFSGEPVHRSVAGW